MLAVCVQGEKIVFAQSPFLGGNVGHADDVIFGETVRGRLGWAFCWRKCQDIALSLIPWSWSMKGKITKWETMCKRKVWSGASIWYMWHQFPLMETSIKCGNLFKIVKCPKYLLPSVYCISLLPFYQFMDLKNKRKKYSITKVKNIFWQFSL